MRLLLYIAHRSKGGRTLVPRCVVPASRVDCGVMTEGPDSFFFDWQSLNARWWGLAWRRSLTGGS